MIQIVLAIAMLVAIAPLPYEYYMVFRVICLLGFAMLTWSHWIVGMRAISVSFFVLLIIYNPIFELHLNKVAWTVINIATAVYLIVLVLALPALGRHYGRARFRRRMLDDGD